MTNCRAVRRELQVLVGQRHILTSHCRRSRRVVRNRDNAIDSRAPQQKQTSPSATIMNNVWGSIQGLCSGAIKTRALLIRHVVRVDIASRRIDELVQRRSGKNQRDASHQHRPFFVIGVEGRRHSQRHRPWTSRTVRVPLVLSSPRCGQHMPLDTREADPQKRYNRQRRNRV